METQFPILYWGSYLIFLGLLIFGKKYLGKYRIAGFVIVIIVMLTASFGPKDVVSETYNLLLWLLIPTFIVALNEGGHIIGMLMQGLKIESFLILPFFGQVKLAPQKLTNRAYFLGVWMGPAMSLPMLALGYLWPTSEFAKGVALLGALIGAFNAFPVFQLDGGHMIARLLDKRVSKDVSLLIQTVASTIFLGAMIKFGVATIFIVLLGLPVVLMILALLSDLKSFKWKYDFNEEAQVEENIGSGIVMIKKKLPLGFAFLWIGLTAILLLGFYDLGGFTEIGPALENFVNSMK